LFLVVALEHHTVARVEQRLEEWNDRVASDELAVDVRRDLLQATSLLLAAGVPVSL
jgi:hypothetical protein